MSSSSSNFFGVQKTPSTDTRTSYIGKFAVDTTNSNTSNVFIDDFRVFNNALDTQKSQLVYYGQSLVSGLAPTNLRIVDISNAYVRIQYTANPNAASYEIRTVPESSTWTTTDISYTLTGLSAYTPYAVYVFGVSSDGKKGIAAKVSVLEPPENVVANISFNNASLSLQYSAAFGASTYKIQTIPATSTVTTASLTPTFSGFTNTDISYTVYVYARDTAQGLSFPVLRNIGNKPEYVVVSDITNTTLSLLYAPIVGAAYYDIYTVPTTSTTRSFTTSADISGLTTGTSYTVYIQSVDTSGNRSFYASVAITMPRDTLYYYKFDANENVVNATPLAGINADSYTIGGQTYDISASSFSSADSANPYKAFDGSGSSSWISGSAGTTTTRAAALSTTSPGNNLGNAFDLRQFTINSFSLAGTAMGGTYAATIFSDTSTTPTQTKIAYLGAVNESVYTKIVRVEFNIIGGVLYAFESNAKYTTPTVPFTESSINSTYLNPATSSMADPSVYGIVNLNYTIFPSTYDISGAYTGTISTSVQGVGTISGEWLQIKLPYSLKMTQYTISTRTDFPNEMPRVFYILGSNDGTTWFPIDFQVLAGSVIINAGNPATDAPPAGATFTKTNLATTGYYVNTYSPANYIYFRIVVRSIYASRFFTSISEWNIRGEKNTLSNYAFNGITPTQNDNTLLYSGNVIPQIQALDYKRGTGAIELVSQNKNSISLSDVTFGSKEFSAATWIKPTSTATNLVSTDYFPTTSLGQSFGTATNVNQLTIKNAVLHAEWETRTSAPAGRNWSSICWSRESGLFVAVANAGDTSGNRVATSPDGINWTAQTTPADNLWNSVCWSPDLELFVAVSSNSNNTFIQATPVTGMVSDTFTNANGTYIASASTVSYVELAYPYQAFDGNNSTFWCAEFEDAYGRQYDTNGNYTGNRFSTVISGVGSISGDWLQIKFPFQLVMSSYLLRSTGTDNGMPKLFYIAGSNDGTNWFQVNYYSDTNLDGYYELSNNVVSTTPYYYYRIVVNKIYRNQQMLIPAEWQINGYIIIPAGSMTMTSPNGTTWTLRPAPNTVSWSSVCWSTELSLFAAVASSGTGDRIMTSPDGLTWTSRTAPATVSWNSICWSSERRIFVAVGNNGAMTSHNGIYWVSRTVAASNNWTSVCWSPQRDLFVAVSSSGIGNRIMTSPDGVTWTYRTSPADNNWTSVAWSKESGLFTAVASSGSGLGVGKQVMTSTTGFTWSLRITPVDNSWNSVVWSPQLEMFCAVASSGTSSRVMTNAAKQATIVKNTSALTSASQMNYLLAINDGTKAKMAQIEVNLSGGIIYGYEKEAKTSNTNVALTSSAINAAYASGTTATTGQDGYGLVCVNDSIPTGYAESNVVATTTSTGFVSAYSPITNKIYIFPSVTASANISIYDISNNTISTVSVGTSQIYRSVDYAPGNGKIYARTRTGATTTPSSILVFNPVNNSYTTISLSGLGFNTGQDVYENGVYVDYNKTLVYIPRQTTSVLVIDTSNDVVKNTYAGSFVDDSYFGCVYSPATKKVYGVPFNATTVCTFNTQTNTINLNEITDLSAATGKWLCGILGSNGKIYCYPYSNVTNMLVIDPLANTATQPAGLNIGSQKTINGVVSPYDNKIYGSPYTANDNKMYVINTTNDTYTTIPLISSSVFSQYSTVIANNYNIYSSPTEGSGNLMQLTMNYSSKGYSGAGINYYITKGPIAAQTDASFLETTSLGRRIIAGTDATLLNVQRATLVANWVGISAPAMAYFTVAWSPELGIFAAIGNSTTTVVSNDGITWTSTANSIRSSIWGGICWSPQLGIFAAVAYSGTGNQAAVSSNGITWQNATTNVSQSSTWTAVCWSPELSIFVAVAYNNNCVMVSSTGLTWTQYSITNTSHDAICWSSDLGIFVAVGDRNYMTSTNGINWTYYTMTDYFVNVIWSSQLKLFVAVGVNVIKTSTNGTTWISRTSPVNLIWRGLMWAPEIGLFVATSQTAINNTTIASSDGINWRVIPSASANQWYHIAWSPSLQIFSTVSRDGTNQIATLSAKQATIVPYTATTPTTSVNDYLLAIQDGTSTKFALVEANVSAGVLYAYHKQSKYVNSLITMDSATINSTYASATATATVGTYGVINMAYTFSANGMPVLEMTGPTTDSSEYATFGLTGSSKYWGAVSVPSLNRVYFVPSLANTVLGVDVSTNTIVSTIAVSAGSFKWSSGILAPNGKIYCVPTDATNILIIDPSTNTVDSTTITGITGSNKFIGGALAPNGKIYCPPLTANYVLVIDTSNNTTSQISVGQNGWSGAVLAPNGKIYGVPYSATATSVLIIDPSTNTVDTTTLPLGTTHANMYGGGALASTGRIYCVPFDASNVLIIDPVANTTNRTTLILADATLGKYRSVDAAPNGRLYGIPYNATNVLMIDPGSNTLNTTTVATGLSGLNKFADAAVATNGRIYAAPYDASTVHIITPYVKSVTLDISNGFPRFSRYTHTSATTNTTVQYTVPISMIENVSNNVDAWTHLGVTVDASGAWTTYVNGLPYSTGLNDLFMDTGINNRLLYRQSNLSIGKYVSDASSANTLSAYLDDFRMYPYVTDFSFASLLYNGSSFLSKNLSPSNLTVLDVSTSSIRVGLTPNLAATTYRVRLVPEVVPATTVSNVASNEILVSGISPSPLSQGYKIFVYGANASGLLSSPTTLQVIPLTYKLSINTSTNTSFAGSMRTFVYGYTGPVVRVRRSTDNVESDFYSDVIQTYLTTGTGGTGTSYATWIGAATGYITVWYNQNGSSNHARNTANNATQPNLVLRNGKYIVQWQRANSPQLVLDTAINPNTIFSQFWNDYSSYGTIACQVNTSGTIMHFGMRFGADALTINGDSNNSDWFYASGAPKISYVNGVSASSLTSLSSWKSFSVSVTTPGTDTGSAGFKYIGRDGYNNSRSMNGYMTEFIMHNKVMTADDMITFHSNRLVTDAA